MSPTSKPLTLSSVDAVAKKFSTQFEEINDVELYAERERFLAIISAMSAECAEISC